MYIICGCLFSALSRKVGALQISIIIIIMNYITGCMTITSTITVSAHLEVENKQHIHASVLMVTYDRV